MGSTGSFGGTSGKYVVVVDDHPGVRESLESLFDAAQVDARFFDLGEDLLTLGAVAILEKPFDGEELLEHVDKAVRSAD
jgi:FixJ family two-component response regulator